MYRYHCERCQSTHYEHSRKRRIPFARFIAKHRARCGNQGPFPSHLPDALVDEALLRISWRDTKPRMPRVIRNAATGNIDATIKLTPRQEAFLDQQIDRILGGSVRGITA